MHISDNGIITSHKFIQEKLYILTIFSKKNGICRGAVKINKNNISNFNIGNYVSFSWKARLENQLGLINCEMIRSYQQNIIFSREKLYSFKFISSLVEFAFKEHESHEEFYSYFIKFIDSFKNKDFDILSYFLIELNLLSSLGYHLDISRCCVTNQDKDLSYLSPKTGRAVSRISAFGYESKLLKLPTFIVENNQPESQEDIQNAFDLFDYFFQRYVYSNINERNFIKYREFLRNTMQKNFSH